MGLALALALTMAGCAGGETAGAGEDGPRAQASVTETEGPALEKLSYTFDPHVISREYALIYGEEIEGEFFSFCDAILSGSRTMPCGSRERLFQMLEISDTCFPLAAEVIDKENTRVEKGVCYLAYLPEESELPAILSQFQEKVTAVITAAVPYEAPDFIKAMELYTAVARKDSYDQGYTLDDSLNIKSYRAIMEDTGICQEITGEYIYYLLQAGIDAIPCSALNRDQSEAHVWALVRLNGNWYHVDPTYATAYPHSLFFFGMNDTQREYYGDLPAEQFTYANTDELDREQFRAEDRSFVDFWLAETYQIHHRDREISVREVNTGEEHTVPYPLP